MSHLWKYPQPSEDELTDAPVYELQLNPFWWAVVQGKIGELANPDLWEDYTPEIEQAIHDLMLGQSPD